MKKLFGVTTAMTTPFTADDRVDVEALCQQTNFLIEKGVNCLYPCGTTGEMFLMTAEERELVAETVVREAAGRVTVFIHVGAMSQDETIRLALHAAKIGADGVGIVTPVYFTLDERATIEYYRAVCSALPQDFPVYVYVIPQLAHNDISASTMQKIADLCPNVVGVKYSFADMRRINEYLLVRGGNFSVMPGADDLLLPNLACGCDGVVSGCSSAMPEVFVDVYKAFCAGDLDAARKAQEKATEVVHLLGAGSDTSIFKNVQTMRGVRGGYMRRPLLDLTDEQVSALRKTIAPYL